MKKSLLVVALVFPLVCLLVWSCYLSFERRNFSEVTLSITGYDPRDLLSGRYIAYQIDWDKSDCSQFENKVCPKDEFCKEETWGRQCRFYVSETKAYALERLFASRNSDDNVFEVVFAYQKGRQPIAKELLINGKDWRESLRK
ncbi:MAG: hypothetical protein IKS23_00120 [Alphaproteobacteria bacterium]|nr:hypothetical protein [Alphaproteobacteria bacterium]